MIDHHEPGIGQEESWMGWDRRNRSMTSCSDTSQSYSGQESWMGWERRNRAMTSCADISNSSSSEFCEPETRVLGFTFETFEAESRLPGNALTFTV